MPRVRKEVLCVGSQRDRHGNWFKFTRRDILDARRNTQKLLSRAIPIPCVWEHQNVEAADPEEWKARYARQTFGHVAGVLLNDRGNLDYELEVPDPRDAKQLVKTRFVSPKVYRDYADSKGGEYRGTTIAHVAATPTPVQFWQRPFELSQGEALVLSFARDDMPEDKDDKGGEKKGTETGNLSKLIEALRGAGLNIPEEAKDIDGLIIAVKASGGAGDGDDLDDLDPGAATAPAGGAPMLMSTTDRDGRKRSRALSWAKDERRELWGRVNAALATGRVTPAERTQLKRRIEAVEMSFDAETGEAVHPLNDRLKEIEARPEWSQWSKDGKRPADGKELSNTKGVDVPPELNAEQQRDKAREEAAADQAARAAKYIPAQAAK